MDSCLQLLRPLLQNLAQENKQFPCLLFEKSGCQGAMYPPVNGFNAWNQYLKQSDVGFSTIGSMYIPPHAVLQLWSTDGSGYYELHGQQVVIDTPSSLTFWRNWDDTPCLSGQCGKKIDWQFSGIQRLFIKTNSWQDYLYTLGSHKKTLQIGGTPLSFNMDQFFTDLCARDTLGQYACQCHNAWQEIITQHAASAAHSYVNLLPNGCDPATHYVPSQANVAIGTDRECLEMIQAQIAAGTFPTLSNGGTATYICNNQMYVNTFDSGGTNPTASFDDAEDASKEELQRTALPFTGWVTLSVMISVAVCLFFLYGLSRFQADKNRSPLGKVVRASRRAQGWSV